MVWQVRLRHCLCREEAEARHLHAQCWFDQPKSKGDINKHLDRICARTVPDWDAAQKKVLRSGTRIGYSDWYLDYLAENEEKSEPTRCMFENVPEVTVDYYPTEEEQDSVMRKKNAVDQRYADLAEKFREWVKPEELERVTREDVALFLNDAQFCSKTICVLKDKRTRIDVTKNLTAYLNCGMPLEEYFAKDEDALG